MTRPRFLAPLLLAVTPAVAPAQAGGWFGSPQPPPPPGAVPARGQPFKPFGGVSADAFYQSSVGRLANQLTLDLAAFRTDLAAARLGFREKQAVAERLDDAARAVQSLERITREGNRWAIERAVGGVEGELADLNRAVERNAVGQPALSAGLARLTYTGRQLEAAAGAGGRPVGGDQLARLVARTADDLDHQAEELRAMAVEQLGPDPAFERAIVTVSRTARRINRLIDDKGQLDEARKLLPAEVEGWKVASGMLNRVPNLAQAVATQAGRVDALSRRLTDLLGGPANPNPPGGWFPTPPPVMPPVISPPPPVRRTALLAVGAGDGGGPRVRVFADARGRPRFDFFAFDENFRGGVRVAVADLNGDGVSDIVVAPGPGMAPLVRVFDGRDASLLVEFNALDGQWQGGLNVAAADMTRDGKALIAVAPDVGGGPHVHVYDLAQGKLAYSFMAYDEASRGGCRVALADIDGDGIPDIVTTPGRADLPPQVRVFHGVHRRVITEFMAFPNAWRGGMFVAAADLTGDGRADIVVGTDAGGSPLVKVFRPLTNGDRPIAEYTPFPGVFRGGVRVAVFDPPGVPPVLVAAAGAGAAGSPMHLIDARTGRVVDTVVPYPGFDGGVFPAGK